MIIERQEDVTPAVLKELAKAQNPRFREIMGAFVRHIHDFVRESKLTEEEFRTAVNYVVALGKASNETHNEGILIAGSLGISSLVCLLNNGDNGQTETDASLLGPFWRMHSPITPNGGSIVRSPTPGPVMFVNATFRDRNGRPIDLAIRTVLASRPVAAKWPSVCASRSISPRATALPTSSADPPLNAHVCTPIRSTTRSTPSSMRVRVLQCSMLNAQ